jgi:hypothetical protein
VAADWSNSARVTETLEVVLRQWKVIQTVREKFTCRSCEEITQPPAPFHVIARARAGASLLAMILYAKFGEHQPLNRQSESYAREGIELCGLVEARVIDLDGVYDPCRPNDRLLLGMKGSISEFELGVLRARMLDAARAKARRGELRISVPLGYVWHREIGLG